LVDTDDFNDLGLDHDFFTEFIRQPEEAQKEAVEDFENEVLTRLQIRAELSGIIAQESLILKSDTFRITGDVFWTKLRFEQLAHKIIKAIENPQKKKLLLDTFRESPDQSIGYY
jgi:hypothetical protein